MSELVCKFDDHLLKLSRSKDLEIAKTEWREICREKMDHNMGLCLCQHKLTNVIFMYNIYTGHTVGIGSTCFKKIGLQTIKMNNRLELILGEMISNGGYKVIDNVLVYASGIEMQVKNYFINAYEMTENIENLLTLNYEMNKLITEYGLLYLQDISNTILEKINRIEKELLKLKQHQEAQNLKERHDALEIQKAKQQREPPKPPQIYQPLVRTEIKAECYHCRIAVTPNNCVEYSEEITERGVIYACNPCSEYTNCFLARGYGPKTFEY